MHETEADELVQCLTCGAEISLALGRAFAVTDTSGICFRCAMARGGSYDEVHDRWLESPSLAGVPAAED